MAEEIRIWQVEDRNRLKEIKRSKLDLEERLEVWLEKDISILSDDLLVIGRQMETDFGGIIDLLCLNRNGDVVIVELKRRKTPRDVTAQVLDYGSWVRDLPNEQITGFANSYLGERGPLEEAFKSRFGEELPDVLNENHSMLIVASEVDSASERIIKYLSDTYGVNINAVTFQYFRDEHMGELLARVFLIEPGQVEYKSQKRGSSKRRVNLTYDELEELAEKAGFLSLYHDLFRGLNERFYKGTTRSSAAFYGDVDGSVKVIFSLIPTKSTPERGLCFQVYSKRFQSFFEISEDVLVDMLPSTKAPWRYYHNADEDMTGFEGFFMTEQEVERFLKGLGNNAHRH